MNDSNKVQMISDIEFKHLAYCGFDCGKCPIFIATENNDAALKIELANKFSTPERIMEPAEIECTGCRSDLKSIHEFCSRCEFRLCAREKKLTCCGECSHYPCPAIELRFPIGCESRRILDKFSM